MERLPRERYVGILLTSGFDPGRVEEERTITSPAWFVGGLAVADLVQGRIVAQAPLQAKSDDRIFTVMLGGRGPRAEVRLLENLEGNVAKEIDRALAALCPGAHVLWRID